MLLRSGSNGQLNSVNVMFVLFVLFIVTLVAAGISRDRLRGRLFIVVFSLYLLVGVHWECIGAPHVRNTKAYSHFRHAVWLKRGNHQKAHHLESGRADGHVAQTTWRLIFLLPLSYMIVDGTMKAASTWPCSIWLYFFEQTILKLSNDSWDFTHQTEGRG